MCAGRRPSFQISALFISVFRDAVTWVLLRTDKSLNLRRRSFLRITDGDNEKVKQEFEVRKIPRLHLRL